MPADGCHHVAEWMRSNPCTSVPLDESVLLQITARAMELVTPFALSGQGAEACAALVKVLAAMEGAWALDLTEDDVFARSQKLREAFYLEIMQYRRAMKRDEKAELV